jgi:signal transduction histidine kinase
VKSHPLLTVEIRQEQDVVLCRQRARQIAGLLGYTQPEQTSVATAVSEIARNAFRYAGGGRAEFSLAADADGRSLLLARVSDRGPGIPNLQQILDGQYRSTTGMGIGLTGSRRLSDHFAIDAPAGRGTVVTLGRRLPSRAPPVGPPLVATITAELAQRPPQNLLEEAQQQNRELLRAMELLQLRQEEVERLNAELAETNRGVLALYAELDEKAVSLERASAYKSRFLSDMSHELRTPLNAMISLSGLLLDRTDGELTGEQEHQVSLIRRSAQSLTDMVNDLLDLAKIEAGKIDLRVAPFETADLLAALRGIFRPLVPADGKVRFVVDDPPPGLPTLQSDEGKLSQILRNLASNALKFTEQGEVRVWVEYDQAHSGSPAAPPRVDGARTAADAENDGKADEDNAGRPGPGLIRFRVADTGIGIAPDDQPRIFDDFTQVDSPIQRRVRGTGLGLPLSRKLARLLGGDVMVQSRPGAGSTFTVTIPARAPASPPSPVGENA